MAIKLYRRENLVESNTYKTSSAEVDELVESLRSKWAFLRDNGWAADNPVLLLRGVDTVTEVFSWISDAARAEADRAESPWNAAKIDSLAPGGVERRRNTEVLRGFQVNFPRVG